MQKGTAKFWAEFRQPELFPSRSTVTVKSLTGEWAQKPMQVHPFINQSSRTRKK